jgi:NAD(P)-dependent dehydrogenase (short-subunit alcohol dehydrogenase family)
MLCERRFTGVFSHQCMPLSGWRTSRNIQRRRRTPSVNDVNVLSTQRVNRAALPQLRKQGRGLLVWVSSSSVAGGTPPYLSPYFAAKAGMDALAVQYARELALWGIETSIIMPGAFTKGTNHFAHAGTPADKERVAEYEAGPYKDYGKKIQEAFAAIVPDDADVSAVAHISIRPRTEPKWHSG